MGLREQLRRLRREAEGELIEIPQTDGTMRRFSEADLKAAFLNGYDRVTADPEDRPPEHPLIVAARNSSSPEWRNSFFAIEEDLGDKPLEDLSE